MPRFPHFPKSKQSKPTLTQPNTRCNLPSPQSSQIQLRNFPHKPRPESKKNCTDSPIAVVYFGTSDKRATGGKKAKIFSNRLKSACFVTKSIKKMPRECRNVISEIYTYNLAKKTGKKSFLAPGAGGGRKKERTREAINNRARDADKVKGSGAKERVSHPIGRGPRVGRV